MVNFDSKIDLFLFLHDMNVNKNRCGYFLRESNFKNNFNYYEDFKSITFKEHLPFKQLLWHYLQDDYNLELGKCEICSKRLKFYNFQIGYRRFCSQYCQSKSESVNKKRITTNLEKYGAIAPCKNENIKLKLIKTNNEKYGGNSPLCDKKINIKSSYKKESKYGNKNYNNLDKRKNTCIKKYCVINPSTIDTIKEKSIQTCNRKYGTKTYTQTKEYKEKIRLKCDEIKEKVYNTKKKNNTFNTSKIELQLKKYFEDNNIIFISQYKDERYPFACDFYFPEKDLFVEIQGSWTHGNKPFNIETDLTIVQEWLDKNSKYYDNAIETWTVRDVKKREIAIKNNLNYLEIFSIDFNECIEKIIKYSIII